MAYTKQLLQDTVGCYIQVNAIYRGLWLHARYATYDGMLSRFLDYNSNEPQANFLMSQIPASFPLIPAEQTELEGIHERYEDDYDYNH